MTRSMYIRQTPESRIVRSDAVQRLLLTSAEASAALGMSRDQLYHLRKAGRIPFVQASERRYYYPVHELEAWMRGEWRSKDVSA